MRMLAAAVLGALASLCSAQVMPLPNTPDGYSYPSFSNATAQVRIDAYFDLMCPDSAAAWPVLKAVLATYTAAQIKFIYHTFPLPYHHFAYPMAQAAHIAAENGYSPYTWMEAVYAAQNNFGNTATNNNSWNQVAQQIANLAKSSIGMDPNFVFNALSDPNYDEDTRVSWKYACSRGVVGTPTFFVNEVRVDADESWTVQQWQALLDPLFS